MKNSDLCIIVPCYNESGSIAQVVKSLAEELPGACILVVDDRSGDNTEAVARSTGLATVVSLPVNLGVGGAVQTGFKYAVRRHYKYAVKFDGDGQHPAGAIKELLRPLQENRADVVIGSRFLDEGGFKSSFVRRIGIVVFRVVNSLLIGQLITDNTSGFRAYNRKSLRFMEKYYPAFDYPEPEEVVLLGRNDFRICEIPVQMSARSAGHSSINVKRSFYFMFKVLFAVLMVALRPKVKTLPEDI